MNPDPAELVALTDEEFRKRYKNSPIERTKLRGLKRNAAFALGNAALAKSPDAPAHALSDAEQLARDCGVWALSQLRN